MKYDYFIGGRWRNHEAVRVVLEAVRSAGKAAYCFIENSYSGNGVTIDVSAAADVEIFMRNLETHEDWRTNPTVRQIYDTDMNGIKNAVSEIFVLPMGASAHMELGVAFNMGKACYGSGEPENHETLYLMFNEIYPDVQAFSEAQLGVAV